MVTIREPDLTSNVFRLRQSFRLPRRTLHVYRRSILGHVLSLVVGNVNVVHMLSITGEVEVFISTPPYTVDPPPTLPDNPLDIRLFRIVEEPLEYLLTHPVGYGVRAIISPEVYGGGVTSPPGRVIHIRVRPAVAPPIIIYRATRHLFHVRPPVVARRVSADVRAVEHHRFVCLGPIPLFATPSSPSSTPSSPSVKIGCPALVNTSSQQVLLRLMNGNNKNVKERYCFFELAPRVVGCRCLYSPSCREEKFSETHM